MHDRERYKSQLRSALTESRGSSSDVRQDTHSSVAHLRISKSRNDINVFPHSHENPSDCAVKAPARPDWDWNFALRTSAFIRIFILPRPEYLPFPNRHNISNSSNKPEHDQQNGQSTGKSIDAVTLVRATQLYNRQGETSIREYKRPPIEGETHMPNVCQDCDE